MNAIAASLGHPPPPVLPSTPLPDLTLRNISMTVEKGAMIGIVGGMASGKTTLVSALMGEMRRTRGTCVVNDKVIIAPNSPWMKSGTIRDNVLFGSASADASLKDLGKGGKLYEKVCVIY